MIPGKNKTSYEIGLERDDKLREKLRLDETHKNLKQEIISIQYEIAKLRVKQKELEGELNKSEFNLKKVSGELKLLASDFWSAKESGI